MSDTSLALGGSGPGGRPLVGTKVPGSAPAGRGRALVLSGAAVALALVAVAAVVLAVAGVGGRTALGGGPGGAPLGPGPALVGLGAAGVVVAVGIGAGAGVQVARRRIRAAERAAAAADRAASLDRVRGGLVAALRDLHPDGQPASGPDPAADELERRPASTLVDDLVEAVRARADGHRADQREWSATLEQLGWTGYNLAARQLRLLDRLDAELVGSPADPAAGRPSCDSSIGPTIGPALAELGRLAAEQQRRARSALVLSGGPTPGLGSAPSHRPAPWPLAQVVRLAGAGLGQPDRLALGPVAAVEVRPALVADLVHVLAILLDNALRYSPAHQPVGVDAAAAPASARLGTGASTGASLRITDGGIGFPPGRRSAATGTGGGGLGLQVVQRLAARHGFTVDVHPRPDRPGTTVVVGLPSALLVPAEPVALPAPS